MAIIEIRHAVQEHGAEAVYRAACAAIDGNYTTLAAMEIEASTLADAWQVQTSAYKRMSAGERAREQMSVNTDLMEITRDPVEFDQRKGK